jgi:hypothetical protein
MELTGVEEAHVKIGRQVMRAAVD